MVDKVIEVLVGFQQLSGHGERVVEIGEGGTCVELRCAGLDHGLSGLLNGSALLVGWMRAWEPVVSSFYRTSGSTLHSRS